MAREKFQNLTEPMFYILLCLMEERCGTDIMNKVKDMTDGRVIIGPGTLYALLDRFLEEGYIKETSSEGRKRNYKITVAGKQALSTEYIRLQALAADYRTYAGLEG